MPYAQNTSVSVEKSRAEIETLLRRYGADKFAYVSDDAAGTAVVAFQFKERQIRFNLPLPKRSSQKFTIDARYNQRPSEAALKLWEQACRTKWRALKLCIQAKLEAVAANITTFEHEFLAHIVTEDGMTVADKVVPLLKNSGPLRISWQ